MKITIIGAGNVGSTCAIELIRHEYVNEIVLVDAIEGLAEGKSLDINHSLPLLSKNVKVCGTSNNYDLTKNSDVIVITAGIKRKENMTRNDLMEINSQILKQTLQKSLEKSPNAIVIITTNPLDNMVYQAYLSTKVKKSKLIGMASLLDASRFVYYLSIKLKISVENIKTTVLGSHNNNMVILSRYTTIDNIPLSNFLTKEEIEKCKLEAINAGKEIIKKTGISAWCAPGIATAKLIKCLSSDIDILTTASVVLEGEYGIKDCCLSVPIILNKKGIKKIVELDLNNEEKQSLNTAADTIKESNKMLCP